MLSDQRRKERPACCLTSCRRDLALELVPSSVSATPARGLEGPAPSAVQASDPVTASRRPDIGLYCRVLHYSSRQLRSRCSELARDKLHSGVVADPFRATIRLP